jgi:hypothetical protein
MTPIKTDTLEKWTANLLIFLAVGAFVLSFAGMYAVAVDAGYGWLALLWPLVTESAVVIFSLLYLVAKLKGYDNKYLMPVIIACTALSVMFNVWHSPKTDYLSRAVYALPPLFLFAAFKGYLWKVEQDTKRAGLVRSVTELSELRDLLTGELDTLRVEVVNLAGQIEQAKAQVLTIQAGQIEQKAPSIQQMNEARQSKIDERRQLVLSLLGEGLSEGDISERLNVSVRTIQRDIVALNGQVTK